MSSLPLLKRVVAAMEQISPLALADNSWDNVGLLVEHPSSGVDSGKAKKVMLTIDLSPAVLRECIQHEVQVIISYHPPIFAPLKRLTTDNVKQSIVLSAIANGMSIYSPHSALDSTADGMNDWLCDAVGQGSVAPIAPLLPNGRKPVNESDKIGLKTGVGRLLNLSTAATLDDVVKRVKGALNLPTVRVALPTGCSRNLSISSVAACAGSGSGVFKLIPRETKVDLLLTGEMSHHDVLAWNDLGTAVILCEHTNSERGYLKDRLQGKLATLLGPDVAILVAEADADPLVVW